MKKTFIATVEEITRKNFLKKVLAFNPGAMDAYQIWYKIKRQLDGIEPLEYRLINNKVLHEHFTVGHCAASVLAEAYKKAEKIKVIREIDSRSMPVLKLVFMISFQVFYEVSFTFCPRTGEAILSHRAEMNFKQAV